MGLFHQQSRPDRDQFLDVYRYNVKPDMWAQYEIPESSMMRALQRDIPYDYFSVMQYGKYAFAKFRSGKPVGLTMKPKKPCFLDIIGNVKGLSFYDAKLINRVYGCVDGCENTCSDSEKAKNCYGTRKGNQRCKCYCPEERYSVKCDSPCPWGDVGITIMEVGNNKYTNCKELHAAYPNYACTNKDYKDKCRGTCSAKNTFPCQDKPGCDRMSCQYINVENDCPVKCGGARRGERKCAAPKCEDESFVLTVDGRNRYTSCAQLYAAYPNFACVDDEYKAICCKTCQASTAPCSDKPDCRFKSCGAINNDNDCPVKCGKARRGEKKCFGSGGGGRGAHWAGGKETGDKLGRRLNWPWSG